MISKRLAFALETAYRAGRSTLSHFNVGVEVEMKEDRTPVTLADRQTERMIRKAIEQRFPGEAILGEEEGASGGGGSRWVVDPIDGTKSFVCGVPLYATLLSYEEEGEPVVAVSYFPALDEMVYAEKGQGAYLNGRPCRVSEKGAISESVISSGGHLSMERQGRSSGFIRLAEEALATRTWSDAYGHCLVATGRIEAMIDPIVNYWDVSAVDLIVREAGGRFTNFIGESGRYAEAISSNGLLHARIVEAFRS